MKKKFYSFCCLLTLPLLLTSCSQKKTDDTTDSSSADTENVYDSQTQDSAEDANTPQTSDSAENKKQPQTPADDTENSNDEETPFQPEPISLSLSQKYMDLNNDDDIYCSGSYSLIQTDLASYPKLQDVLTAYNLDMEDSIQDTLNDCYEDYQEHHSKNDSFSYASISIQHDVYRSDSAIISILYRESEYSSWENEDEFEGLNIDPVTGKFLHLKDVVQDMDFLSSALEEAIREQVPSGSLRDNLSQKLNDMLEDDDLDNAGWNLGYQYLVFSFEPGSIAKEQEGELTIYLQDTDGIILKERYLLLPNRYVCQIPTEIPFYADIDGDGTTDSLLVHGDITDYDAIETIYVRLNDMYTTFESWSYKILPYLVRTEDHRTYLYLDTLHDNDYHSISVVDLNGTSPTYVDTMEGGLYNSVFCDPEQFTIETRMDLLSTYSGIRSCSLGNDGMPEAQQDTYDIVNDITLTAKKDLKVKDGKITAGSKCKLLRTDGKSWVEVELDDGSTRTIEVEHNGWPQMIQGKKTDEYFDDMIFAG